jgi:hypothetical protein
MVATYSIPVDIFMTRRVSTFKVHLTGEATFTFTQNSDARPHFFQLEKSHVHLDIMP